MPAPVSFDISSPGFIEWLEQIALPAWFKGQRWFARRHGFGEIQLNVQELGISPGGLVLGLVDEAGADEAASPYFVAFTAISSEYQSKFEGGFVVGEIPAEFTSQNLVLVEAAATDAGRQLLLKLATRELNLEWSIGKVQGRVFELKKVVNEKLSWSINSHLLGAEQSNTSLVFNDQVILKLLRRPDGAGEPNPDVEIPLALSVMTEFPLTPPVMGVIQAGDDETGLILGTLCRYLAGARTGWELALEAVNSAMKMQSDELLISPLDERLSRDLAIRTAQVHLALAKIPDNEAFKPVPIRAEDFRSLGTRLSGWADGLLDSLQKWSTSVVSNEILLGLNRVIAEKAKILSVFEYFKTFTAENENQTFLFAIRHHGDYHLGQVLWSETLGWQAIDFEGEPSRSLEERRAKAIALRDVAGMVRSFDYAHAVACRDADADKTEVERAKDWRDHVTSIFTNTYFAMAGELENEIFPLVPESYVLRLRLLKMFVLEKNLYELIYELEHRPDWVYVPLNALLEWLE